MDFINDSWHSNANFPVIYCPRDHGAAIGPYSREEAICWGINIISTHAHSLRPKFSASSYFMRVYTGLPNHVYMYKYSSIPSSLYKQMNFLIKKIGNYDNGDGDGDQWKKHGGSGQFRLRNAKKELLIKKEPLKIGIDCNWCKSLFNVADLLGGMWKVAPENEHLIFCLMVMMMMMMMILLMMVIMIMINEDAWWWSWINDRGLQQGRCLGFDPPPLPVPNNDDDDDKGWWFTCSRTSYAPPPVIQGYPHTMEKDFFARLSAECTLCILNHA